ncbi:MAG: tetratricopeptide repeat protein [Nitrospiria bacterium]
MPLLSFIFPGVSQVGRDLSLLAGLTIKIFILSAFLIGTFLPAASLHSEDIIATVHDLLKGGDQLFHTRDEDDHAERAILSFRQALEANPKNYGALWRLSRSYQWQGDLAVSTDEKLQAYREAEEYARKAIALNPKGPDGHLVLGIALGRIGETRGVMKSLSLISPIKKEMKAVLAGDPQNDVAIHVLGVLYRKVPGLFGGSTRKSIQLLEKAIVLDPSRTVHYLELSRSYLEKGKTEAALQALEALLAVTQATDPPQTKIDRKEAEVLLSELRPE